MDTDKKIRIVEVAFWTILLAGPFIVFLIYIAVMFLLGGF